MATKLIFERSESGRRAVDLPLLDVPDRSLDELLPDVPMRPDRPRLPEIDALELIRHYVGISILNHHIEKGFYPLGSCTMKANPPLNEQLAGLEGFTSLHPLTPEYLIQGAMKLLASLEDMLTEVCGMDAISLQPAAGAHGELTGLLVVRAYHDAQGNPRKRVIIPDAAHGTNPASAAFVGYETVEIKSNSKGLVDVDALRDVLDEDVAVFMLTNPNTLGLFEREIATIQKMVHDVGALLYMDGANMNALLGIARPGDMGFDLVHLNLHKTFSTPHGGGGPGSGPLAVKKHLEAFLPVPRIIQSGDIYRWDWDRPQSVGKVMTWWGQFGVLIRAYAYLRANGAAGLKNISESAILNANYLRELLESAFDFPYPKPCMHEFVLSGDRQKKRNGVRTLDMAKRLLDKGVHAPTVYFPLIVSEGMMVEPPETESRHRVEDFAQALLEVAKEAEHDPETVRNAPHTTPVGRLDETKAARQPDLAYRFEEKGESKKP